MAHVRREGLSGARIRDAIIQHFDEWIDRRIGFLTFRLTQLLTGHGCFGCYLFRIGKEDTPTCPYCYDGEDTADHTIQICDAWIMERAELCYAVGPDLSIPALIGAMCRSHEEWAAFSVFAERVMWKKEEDERRRQAELLPPALPATDHEEDDPGPDKSD